MKKLIELLNEYIKDKDYRKIKFAIDEYRQLHCSYIVGDTVEGEPFSEKWLSRDVSQAYLISKEYGFIKWLVDNDKIDFDKCGICYEINSTHDHYNLEERQDLWLIMLLSISHTPIEDLVSYLR